MQYVVNKMWVCLNISIEHLTVFKYFRKAFGKLLGVQENTFQPYMCQIFYYRNI